MSRARSLEAPVLSVIIPVRNDAAALKRTLDHADRFGNRRSIEVIVAASGDVDGTRASVRDRATVIWPADSTRAALMNAGAAIARGDVLLFLHADSLPPQNVCRLIYATLEDERLLGGAFEHRFIERDWRLRIISGIDRVRYRLTRNYYGDQGMFVRATAFHRLGGFRTLALMEDLDFSQRLKRLGATRLITVPVGTSARRFIERGPWRTLVQCGWLVTLWTLGVDTERFARRWRGPVDQVPGSPWPRARARRR
jgi:rSAM/selenodomain-associated transferase 2